MTISNMIKLDDILALLTLSLLVIFTGLLIYFEVQDVNKWIVFSKAHGCIVSEEMSGDVSPTTTMSISGQVGVGTTYTPSKIGYKCDDGKTYWR